MNTDALSKSSNYGNVLRDDRMSYADYNERLVLDALRKKRNLNDYSGDLIDPQSVRECIARAEALLAGTQQWLAAHYADLLQDNE
jgi:hypothetical protein